MRETVPGLKLRRAEPIVALHLSAARTRGVRHGDAQVMLLQVARQVLAEIPVILGHRPRERR